MLDLTGEGDVPVGAFLEDGGLFDGAFYFSGLMELDPADFGEEDAITFDFNALGKTKTFVVAFFLEAGVAGLLALLHTSKKVGEGAVKVFEGLLEDLAMDLFEPGGVGMVFEGDEFVVLVEVGGAGSCSFVGFLSLI